MDRDNGTGTRRPRAALAAVAGIVSLGLGYLYIGRVRLALAVPALIFGLVALAGWTRFVMEPVGFYVLCALILSLWLTSIVHPTIAAYRLDDLAAKPFNRAWVYMAWIAAFAVTNYYASENRAALFGFESFRIPAGSMSPTVQRNDLIMVDTWYFERRRPAIDDLVVFDMPASAGTKYIKRIVALPGDTLEIREDVLLRNGESVVEPFIQLTARAGGIMSNFGPVVVPDEHYFVLGDNRHNSRDSRFIGSIHEKVLYGRAEHRWFAYADGISWPRFPERLNAEAGQP